MWWVVGWVAIVAADLIVGWGAPVEVKALDLFLGAFYLVLGPAVILNWRFSDRVVERMSEKALLVSLAAVAGVVCLGIVLGNWVALVIGILVVFGVVIANLNRVIAGAMGGGRTRLNAEERAATEERTVAFQQVASELRRGHHTDEATPES